jgi:hypothetical protein
MPRVRTTWLLNAATVLPVVVLAGLAVRPYLDPVRYVHLTRAQQAAGLRLGPQPFWALSLHWVFWYIGVPAVLLATLGTALLARRCLQGRAPAWVLPLTVFAWIIVTVLYRPAIAPTHPYASRRLVPGVLPGLILLAVWASGWLVGWLRQHGYGRVVRAGLVSACAAALVLPAAVTAFGLGIRDGGPLGIRPVARPAVRTTYSGEIAAVTACARRSPRFAVVIIDDRPLSGSPGHPWDVRRPDSARMQPRSGNVQQVLRGA